MAGAKYRKTHDWAYSGDSHNTTAQKMVAGRSPPPCNRETLHERSTVTAEHYFLHKLIYCLRGQVLTNFKIDDDNCMALDCDTYHGFIEDLQIGGIAPEGREAMLVLWDFM